MSKLSVVGVAGSPSTPSSSRRLIDLVIGRIGQKAGIAPQVIDLSALRALSALSRADADGALESALRAVESADLLVVASPVYKGSYTGLFKHFIDLLDQRALVGTPVALLATGGGDRHALVIEHQLRPLFAFFQAQILGTGVFVSAQEFIDGAITTAATAGRIDRLVEEAVSALSNRAAALEAAAA